MLWKFTLNYGLVERGSPVELLTKVVSLNPQAVADPGDALATFVTGAVSLRETQNRMFVLC